MLVITSPSPPGAVAVLASVRCIVTGNMVLAIIATIADRKVLNKYKIITVLNLEPIPLLAFDIAEATKTKTKIGAIALRALTNSSPGKPIIVHFGTETPKTAPITRPITIFKIRLDSVHFLTKFLI